MAAVAKSRNGILVTGADGFIGSAVVRQLVGRGRDVRALCGGHASARPLPSGVPSVTVDVRDLDPNLEIARGCRAVVHLAGPPSVAGSFADPQRCRDIHVGGTTAIATLCKAQSIPHLVYLSSAEVYALSEADLVSERHPTAPRSPYGKAKLEAERVVCESAARSDFRAMILRPFSIYGPGMSEASLPAEILRQATTGSCITVNDLRPVRDYCHVDDVAQAVAIAATTSGGGIVNVGSGRGVSVRDFARFALTALGRSLPIAERSGARRRGDALRLVAETERAAALLGWRASTPLESGLRSTAAQLREVPCEGS